VTTTRPGGPLPAPDGPEVPGEPDGTGGRWRAGRPLHRWGFGAFLLVEAVLLASAAFVAALVGPTAADRPLPVSDVLVGTIAPTVIAALVAIAATVLRGNGPLLDLRLEWRWDDVRTGLRFGALGLVFTTLGAYVWTAVVGDVDATSAISSVVGDQKVSVAAALVLFLYVWLLGPVCEEVIYRGLLWGAVERLHWGRERWGRLAAFLLSTGVFAASHLEPLRTTLLLVVSIPIGLARLSTGRLLGSIVTHQVNNFLPAVAMLLTSLGVEAFR
jgi:membrane protease YdiL (CAAX protease family)